MDKVVVYAGTRNLYEQMYVCLKSLLAHNQIDRVYLLIEDDEYPFDIPPYVYPLNVSGQEFFKPGTPNYSCQWSYMSMLRCAFGNMFPEEHKILWLDCDTIVHDNITDLFDMDINGYMYVGAIERQNCIYLFKYINCGVLLMNLDMIRERGREEEMISMLNTYPFAFPDQDVINLLCQGWIRVISSEYNANAFTDKCSRPRIFHFAAVKDFHDNPIYKYYDDLDVFGFDEEESKEEEEADGNETDASTGGAE